MTLAKKVIVTIALLICLFACACSAPVNAQGNNSRNANVNVGPQIAAIETANEAASNTPSSSSNEETTSEIPSLNQDGGMPTPDQAHTDMRSKEEQRWHNYDQALTPYKQTAGIGETLSVTNMEDIEIEPAHIPYPIHINKFVAWTGTLDIAIDSAVIYESLDEAPDSITENAIFTPSDRTGYKLLAMQATITNVDAVPGFSADDPWPYFTLDMLNPSFTCTGIDPITGTPYSYRRTGELASFDSAPEDTLDKNRFALAQGETKTFTVGWWISTDAIESTIAVRPSLSSTEPGPFIFELGFGKHTGDTETSAPTASDGETNEPTV